MIDGVEASKIALINRAVPAKKLESEVNELAEGLALYPRDGIVFGKIQRHLVYDIMGVTRGFAPAYIIHSFHTNMRWEPNEYNFFKERRDGGVTKAAHGKHDFYKKLDK
jgi:enoyl-CoA hydratase